MSSINRFVLVLLLASSQLLARVALAQTWVTAWGRAPLSTTVTKASTSVQSTTPRQFSNQTLRLIAFATVGGTRVRVRFTNQFSSSPLQIAAAHVALRQSGGALQSGTDRALTFGGNPSTAISAGSDVWSDPVSLTVPQQTDIAVSIYLPDTFTPQTFHPTGLKTSYLSKKGNWTDAGTMPAPTSGTRTTTTVFFVSEIQVESPSSSPTLIAALGDSITDGACSDNDANGSWPDLLAKRLPTLANGSPVGVVNAGIGSNRLVASNGAGLSGSTRLADLLLRPALRWVVVLEGVNDISYESATAATLIAAHQAAIAAAHAAGVKIAGIPILPFRHSGKDVGENWATASAVNSWIRTSSAYDAVIDFEPVIGNPSDPGSLNASLTCDKVHPNQAGYRAMANAIDLSIFQ